MNHVISSCLVTSTPFNSHPNGELTGRANVSWFNNKNVNRYEPVKVDKIDITNPNGVSFFKRDSEISTSALRAIAGSLLEIAENAETARERMFELNK